MKKAYIFIVIFFVNQFVHGQRITVDRNGKNPHLHAFSLHQLPPLYSLPGSDQKPFYEAFTFFGDGVFSMDSIFSGTPHDDRYGFSSPITFARNMYPSASNYPYIVLLRSHFATNTIESLMRGQTIEDQPLKENEGMCNPLPAPSVMGNKKIRMIANSEHCDSGQYLGLVLSFLTHSDSSKIVLQFDNKAYIYIDKVIPNIVQSITFNEKESNLQLTGDQKGKMVFDIKKIPTYALGSSYELRIAVFFQKISLHSDPALFTVDYLNEIAHPIDSDSTFIGTRLNEPIQEIKPVEILEIDRSNENAFIRWLKANGLLLTFGLVLIVLLLFIYKRFAGQKG